MPHAFLNTDTTTHPRGGSASFTVEHVLLHMNDLVWAINDLNTKGDLSAMVPIPNTQEATNQCMHEKISTLEEFLYNFNGLDGEGDPHAEGNLGPNFQPDIVAHMANGGDSSTYVAAINLGKAYIAANS